VNAAESQAAEWSGRQDVAVIGDASLTLGFRLAGVREYSVVDGKDQTKFDAELSRMLDSDKYSVLIVGQRQLTKISPSISKKIMETLLPIVVGVPDKEGGGQTSDPMRQMLKRTLGVEMK
jgi:V/A-type H+/Na+-transporting ATPase subunit F